MKFSVVDLEMFRGVCKQMCLKTILLFLFNAQVVSSYLQPQRLQHPRLLCPPISLGIYSSSCPLSQWCHPTMSSSVIPFSLLQSFPASGSFFQWVSSSYQVAQVLEFQLQLNIQDWFSLGWTGWTSFQSKGLSRGFFNTTLQKHQFIRDQLSSWSNSHIHTWPLEKP